MMNDRDFEAAVLNIGQKILNEALKGRTRSEAFNNLAQVAKEYINRTMSGEAKGELVENTNFILECCSVLSGFECILDAVNYELTEEDKELEEALAYILDYQEGKLEDRMERLLKIIDALETGKLVIKETEVDLEDVVFNQSGNDAKHNSKLN